MKSNPSSSLVNINVEVHVNVPGLEPRLEAPVATAGTINIDIPASGSAKVWTDPTTGSRFICAQGTLSAHAPTVYAHVYQGVMMSPPASPPSGCNFCTPGSTGPFPWYFDRNHSNLLPIADCVASGTNPYTLVVWAMFDGNTSYTTAKRSFDAICSTQTDCDSGSGAPSLLARAGYPVLSAQTAGGPQPPLIGKLRMKTGRFAALHEIVRFRWKDCEQAWEWVSEQPGCGSYLLFPFRDWFLLQSTVSNPPLIPARAAGSRKPLHLTFEVTASGNAGEPEGFVLEVREASSSSGGE
jgi:hypothetical protein